MSIRLRLSLLYSAILGLTLVILSIVLYTTQSQYTLNWLKQDLVISSETLSQSILQNALSSPPTPGNGQPLNPSSDNIQPTSPLPVPTLSLSENQTFQRQSQQEVVRVLDPDGSLMASPVGSTEITLPLDEAGLQAVRNQQNWWATETVAGTQLLIYSHPVILQGRVVAILQVARALTERNQSLQALRQTLILATLIAILGAFGAGWLLAREALRPIWRISQTAQAIGSEQDFSRRVVYTGPQDEVGQLAMTFNTMLAELQEAYQQVAHALDMQRSFVADVSHELRTPLTTLRGNLGLLSRQPALPQEDQADIIEDMVEESDRLIRLVNDLLALARADAGRNLAKDTVNISTLLEESCRQARQLAPERQIALDAPPFLLAMGDRDALKQVLLIVLDNALKHTQGAIELSARTANGQVVIDVCDEGPGIPPDQLAHVFERFYRGEDQIGVSGLGLGLPIAKALMEGQNGTIQIQSEQGQGSIVLISLPMQVSP